MTDLELRRKLSFRAHGSTLVLIKRPVESAEHVLQKALLWALYLPSYPALRVEVPLPGPSRYKPDLLALEAGRPRFWGECGVVSTAKLNDVLQRYRATHFAFSKWDASNAALDAFHAAVERALYRVARTAPVEVICFPAGAEGFVDGSGQIMIGPEAVVRRRWE